jgi:hypothetical protein
MYIALLLFIIIFVIYGVIEIIREKKDFKKALQHFGESGDKDLLSLMNGSTENILSSLKEGLEKEEEEILRKNGIKKKIHIRAFVEPSYDWCEIGLTFHRVVETKKIEEKYFKYVEEFRLKQGAEKKKKIKKLQQQIRELERI